MARDESGEQVIRAPQALEKKEGEDDEASIKSYVWHQVLLQTSLGLCISGLTYGWGAGVLYLLLLDITRMTYLIPLLYHSGHSYR